MGEKFKVLEYEVHNNVHVCQNLDNLGIQIRMDLTISGHMNGMTNSQLVGKIIDVVGRHPFMWIADDLSIVEEKI